MYKILLGPGRGLGNNHLANQTSLLNIMYEAPGGHPGPSHRSILWELTHEQEENTDLELQDWV